MNLKFCFKTQDQILKSHNFTNTTSPGILVLLNETKFVRLTVENTENSRRFLEYTEVTYGQTDCIKEVEGEYFTNTGGTEEENYENSLLCLYFVTNPGKYQ